MRYNFKKINCVKVKNKVCLLLERGRERERMGSVAFRVKSEKKKNTV